MSDKLKLSLLRQHLIKATFSHSGDRHTTFALLDELAATATNHSRLIELTAGLIRGSGIDLGDCQIDADGPDLFACAMDATAAIKNLVPKRKLEIEGSPSDGYDAWMTDADGNLCTIVSFAHPMATADWCERNGFAWEVIGLIRGPAVELAKWRAEQ